MNFFKPLYFCRIYLIGMGYMATHRKRGGYVWLMKNLQIMHINKSYNNTITYKMRLIKE